jgi:hypothetical protein
VLRRFLNVAAFASIIAAAACSDVSAPSDDLGTKQIPCSEPAPEPGMVCRGDVWNWS